MSKNYNKPVLIISDSFNNLNKFFLKLREWKFLIFTLGFSLVPLLWFRPWDTLITGGDFWLPLDPLNTVKQLSSAWIENVSGGQINSLPFHLFPWMAFWGFFKTLGLPLTHIEKLWFVSLFAVAGTGIYFLTLEIYKNNKGGWGNFLAATLYLFNLYIMMTGVVTTTLLSYSLLPPLLFFYIKGCNSRSPIRWAIFWCLVSLFLTSSAANPPSYSIPFFVIFLYLIFRLIFSRKRLLSLVIFNLELLIFYLLLNAWWLYLFVKGILAQINQVQTITSAAIVGGSSNFSDLIRLLGSWAFFAGHKGAPYFPFAQSYLNPFLMILTFLIPVLAWAGFFWRNRQDKSPLITFFAFLGLLGIFLSHGQAPDFFGKIDNLFYKFVPFFWIYREPFAKFTMLTALSYSVLLGSLFLYLESRIKDGYKLTCISLITLAVIFTVSWPLIIGEHYPDARGVLAPSRTKIPDYWLQLAQWFKGKENEGRVLVLPDNPDSNRSGIPYVWGYDSGDVGPHLLPVPWVERNNGFYGLPVSSDVLSKIIYRRIHEEVPYPRNLENVFTLLNVGRVLVRNDIDLKRVDIKPENYSPVFLGNFLKGQKDFSLEKTFGWLDVYRFKNRQVANKIYAPGRVVCLSGDTSRMDLALELEASDSGMSFFTSEFYQDTRKINKSCQSFYVLPVEVFNENGQLKSPNLRSKFSGQENDKMSFDLKTEQFSGSPQRVFGFETSQAADYEILFLNDYQTASKSAVATKFLLVKGQGGFVEPGLTPSIPESNGMINRVGDYKLEAGKYVLAVEHPYFTNLVENYSFENKAWESSLAQSQGIVLSNDAVEGQKSMGLAVSSLDAFTTLPELSPKITYEISFNYKYLDGVLPTFFIWENTCDINKPVWRNFKQGQDNSCESYFNIPISLKPSSDWSLVKFDYTPGDPPKHRGLGFVFLDEARRVVVNTGETLIDNVVVRPKFYGGVVVAMASPLSEKIPKISVSWQKKSPTFYVAKVTGALNSFPLVFSETFSPDWGASIIQSGQTRQLSQSQHFVANGFANAWLVDGMGDFEIRLEYKPEKTFQLLFGVSLVSLTTSLIILFRRSLFRRAKY